MARLRKVRNLVAINSAGDHVPVEQYLAPTMPLDFELEVGGEVYASQVH
jgi:hypothetical protein